MSYVSPETADRIYMIPLSIRRGYRTKNKRNHRCKLINTILHLYQICLKEEKAAILAVDVVHHLAHTKVW